MSEWSKYLNFTYYVKAVSDLVIYEKFLLVHCNCIFANESTLHQKTKPHLLIFVLFSITSTYDEMSQMLLVFTMKMFIESIACSGSNGIHSCEMQNECRDKFCEIFIKFSFLSFLIDFYIACIFRRFFQKIPFDFFFFYIQLINFFSWLIFNMN